MTDAKRVWREYFDTEYLTGDALQPDGTTFTIADKSRVAIEGEDEVKHKLVLTFTNGRKFMANVTNCVYLTNLFGSNAPADWIGKRVTLQFDPTVRFRKDVVGGIRVIGSPDIKAPITFQFQENSRKKPRSVTLRPTVSVPATGTAILDDLGPEESTESIEDFWPPDGEND